MKKFVLAMLLLITSFGVVFPQKESTKTSLSKASQNLELSQYKDWQKVELGAYSFYIPKDFKLVKIQGVDAVF